MVVRNSSVIEIAILDDYQNKSLDFGNWESLPKHVHTTVFNNGETNEKLLIERLRPFEILVTMRERTWLPGSVLENLPNLRLIAATGARQANIDIETATDMGIIICSTRSPGHSTSELTWGLILAVTRNIGLEDHLIRKGNWQTAIGVGLEGKTLGLVGLGRVGKDVASIAAAFRMNLLVWSPNMTQERAQVYNGKSVTKAELFSQSDIVTIHIPLNETSRGIISKKELSIMKPSSYLINTSRGPIVNEKDLIFALEHNMIAGAGLDVFDTEPLPKDHALMKLSNVVLSPHLGYVTQENYEIFYGESVQNIMAYLKNKPINVLNPNALESS
jgi:phosphoglycerate dehydrogenase-like enzyme